MVFASYFSLMRKILITTGFILLAHHLAVCNQKDENSAIKEWRYILSTASDDSSRLAAMIELSETLFFFGQSEEAAQLDTAIFELSVRSNLLFGKVRAMLNFCNAQDRLGNFDQALEYLQEGLKISREIGYDVGTCRLILERGAIYEKIGEHTASEKDILDGLELALHIDYYHGMALAYNTIAIIKAKSGQLKESQAGFLKSIEAYQRTHKTFELRTPYNNMGQVHGMMGDQDKALEFFNKALESNKSYGNELGTASQLNNIGHIFQKRGDLPRALEYYQQSLDILESYQSYGRIHYVYGSIGNIYIRQKKYDLAMEYLQKGIELGETQNNKEALANGYGNVANLLNRQGLYQASTTHYLKALSIIESEGELSKVNTHLSKIGDNYLQLRQYDSAKFYFEKALQIGTDLQMNQISDPANIGLAKIYLLQNALTRSERHALDALKSGQSLMDRKLISDAAKTLSRIALQKEDYKKAYTYYEMHATQEDSILNENSIQRLTELSMQYEFDREKKELDLRQQQTEAAYNRELERQKAIQYASFGGVLLFIILAIIFYRSYRRKQQDNARIQEQANQLTFKNEQLTELSNFKEGLTHMIAHDMKNSLNVILGLSEHESEEKMKHIHQSGGQLLSMVLNMLDIQKFEEAQIHLDPSEYAVQHLITEAVLQVELLAHSEGLAIERVLTDTSKVLCNEDLIIRVLVNLLTNAIKYSRGQQKIRITSEAHSDAFITISIQDFGAGIHPDDLPHVFDKFWQTEALKSGQISSTGLGLTFCKLAIEAHGGDIEVDSTYGEGSTFTFTIPKVHESSDSDQQRDLIVSEEEPVVLSLSKELSKLQVYQAGEIFRILNREEARNLQSPWANELRLAVEQSDTDKFRKLVEWDMH